MLFIFTNQQSQDDIPYWPDRSEDLAYGSIRIHLEVEEIEEFYVKRTFTIHHEEDKDVSRLSSASHMREPWTDRPLNYILRHTYTILHALKLIK